MRSVLTVGERVCVQMKVTDQPLEGVIEAADLAALRLRLLSDEFEVYVIPWDSIQGLKVDVIPVSQTPERQLEAVAS